MLKQRIITAVALLAVLAGVVLFLPPPGLLITLTLAISLGIWEWSQFLGLKSLLWPDFEQQELAAVVGGFQGRERRFGKTSAQVSGDHA